MTIYKSLASDLYKAYGAAANWKTYDDKPIPQWTDLPKEIKDRWEAVDSAAFALIVSALKLDTREMKTIRFSKNYKSDFSEAGVMGHNQILLTAKLANALRIE